MLAEQKASGAGDPALLPGIPAVASSGITMSGAQGAQSVNAAVVATSMKDSTSESQMQVASAHPSSAGETNTAPGIGSDNTSAQPANVTKSLDSDSLTVPPQGAEVRTLADPDEAGMDAEIDAITATQKDETPHVSSASESAEFVNGRPITPIVPPPTQIAFGIQHIESAGGGIGGVATKTINPLFAEANISKLSASANFVGLLGAGPGMELESPVRRLQLDLASGSPVEGRLRQRHRSNAAQNLRAKDAGVPSTAGNRPTAQLQKQGSFDCKEGLELPVRLPVDAKFDAHFRWPEGNGPPDPNLHTQAEDAEANDHGTSTSISTVNANSAAAAAALSSSTAVGSMITASGPLDPVTSLSSSSIASIVATSGGAAGTSAGGGSQGTPGAGALASATLAASTGTGVGGVQVNALTTEASEDYSEQQDGTGVGDENYLHTIGDGDSRNALDLVDKALHRWIAANPDAPANQDFQLQKPKQGAGRGDTAMRRGLRQRYQRGKRWREEFKVQIYTFLCIGVTTAL
eukprot:SAG31_NODE_6225_length_2111_cov_1.554672_2_plen_520_part_01